MRTLFLIGLLVATGCAHAQGTDDPAGDDNLSLIVRIERAVWSGADELAEDVEGVFEVDSTEALAEQLRRVRQRGYAAGMRAAEVKLLVELLGALRYDRGDAIPLCTDEQALRQQLALLIIAGDDLVEMDPARFEEVGEPFDAAEFQARMSEAVAPVRELTAGHLNEVEDVCAAAPEPDGHSDHAP